MRHKWDYACLVQRWHQSRYCNWIGFFESSQQCLQTRFDRFWSGHRLGWCSVWYCWGWYLLHWNQGRTSPLMRVRTTPCSSRCRRGRSCNFQAANRMILGSKTLPAVWSPVASASSWCLGCAWLFVALSSGRPFRMLLPCLWTVCWYRARSTWTRMTPWPWGSPGTLRLPAGMSAGIFGRTAQGRHPWSLASPRTCWISSSFLIPCLQWFLWRFRPKALWNRGGSWRQRPREHLHQWTCIFPSTYSKTTWAWHYTAVWVTFDSISNPAYTSTSDG